METRFELVREPSDCFMVWDNSLKEQAMFGYTLLGGMSEIEAKAACDVMNAIHLRQKAQSATHQKQ